MKGVRNCRVIVLDPTAMGKVKKWMCSSVPPGPHFVAVNNKNEIVVTDFHNHSVKVRHMQ